MTWALWEVLGASSSEVLWVALHKARCRGCKFEVALRHESAVGPRLRQLRP